MARTAPEGFKFGCDPELFIVDTDGNLVTADGLIPGTKETPYKVNGGAIQVDGMAAEFNIDPVTNYRDWETNIAMVMEQLRLFLPTGFGFKILPSVNFSQEVMDAAPERAKELGCDPDFNAWTGDVNPKPDTSKVPTLRTASGHIHIGWRDEGEINDEHIGHCRDLVKQMDWFLGGWSMYVDKDVTRRELYGKAGACRYKPYGVEYRTLSNFWIMSSDRRLAIWNRMVAAVDEMKRYDLPNLRKEDNELLIEFINKGKRPDKMMGIKYPFQTLDSVYMKAYLEQRAA
jgi:hypothetical protein